MEAETGIVLMNAPIIIQDACITIRVYRDKFVAQVIDAMGFHEVERFFPHVDDFYELPMHGLARLAKEFYNELEHKLGGINAEDGN